MEGGRQEITLQNIEAVKSACEEQKKHAIIWDKTGNAATFFSYRASTLCEFSTDMVAEKMGKLTMPDVLEKMRKKVVSAVRQGGHFILHVDSFTPNFEG